AHPMVFARLRSLDARLRRASVVSSRGSASRLDDGAARNLRGRRSSASTFPGPSRTLIARARAPAFARLRLAARRPPFVGLLAAFSGSADPVERELHDRG